ncbi:MAG: histidinol dehydrogenase [Bacteroidales bacterium]|nr:histidinol dehydrogenase [Bacteroidales bacterium]MDD6140511.1 histidinol dehydrogenase [Bacteroidales bacterium]MDD6621901.1 histidinol dehydrogenase [Bacteroidales bacterium]MDD6669214.1 histidinol dehydrogenase [Bacteroidales bacterium]
MIISDVLKIYYNPGADEQQMLCRRGIANVDAVRAAVEDIVSRVRNEGDDALRDYAQRFDGATLTDLKVSQEEIDAAELAVDSSLKAALQTAYNNIYAFHAAQRMQPVRVETMPGVVCSQRAVPISRVGLYIPGGNAPLFSTVLMLAIPAKIAGCQSIVMCTPCDRSGRVNPAILYAARLAGVTEIYKVGGAQAVAAMAFGTQSVPRCYKIFGPGNRFVVFAKMLVAQMGVAIDMPAGPSEVLIVADSTANPTFVAADFLSQAEHGPDSQSILVTTSAELAREVADECGRLTEMLPSRDMILKSLAHSRLIVVDSDEAMMDFANLYAPEHLIINHSRAEQLAEAVVNAGSVFLGPYACESAGDYASGTNHTLPTAACATAFSGVNLDSFVKKITFQTISADGIATLGPTIETMANGESLSAHALAATVRIDYVNKSRKQ